MMEQVHNSVVRLAYLKTEDHTADILTKPLPPSSHWHHMEPLLGENPAIAAIMEDVAHIKGRAVCLHVDVRRVPKSLTFHADVCGGGEAGAPGGKCRELAGEQLAVEQAHQAQRRQKERHVVTAQKVTTVHADVREIEAVDTETVCEALATRAGNSWFEAKFQSCRSKRRASS